MPTLLEHLIENLNDPIKEMNLVRNGLNIKVIEEFLSQEQLVVKDILDRLQIPSSTYFARKKTSKPLDAYSTEKFIRLISIVVMAEDILGKAETKNWLYRKIPSLGNRQPLDLLDTEIGHRLVEQTLLQIKYGVYA